ncbi:MAG: tyrosine-type recombinase/integrase [Gammaproteobacteria bacterium]|nr:tyrosine-type recombinase/integrase [Gammaproteobacteria bacterium]
MDGQRGRHPEYVFTYRKHRIARIHNTAWRHARLKATRLYTKLFGKACTEGFRNIRVHDLKHTFGRRLRDAGISFVDRQNLLGHRSSRITTHYSAAELRNLIEAANLVCGENSGKNPELAMLRRD